VFVQLLRNRKKLKINYPSSLLYRIATNLCLNRIRERHRHAGTREEEILFKIAAMDDCESRIEARSILSNLFGRHQESTRTITVLHFLDGMTLAETAREVGMSVSGVRKRLSSLRSSLLEIEQE
jgi:RNA polymerase sigma-70 factor (ECF subfamily)